MCLLGHILIIIIICPSLHNILKDIAALEFFWKSQSWKVAHRFSGISIIHCLYLCLCCPDSPKDLLQCGGYEFSSGCFYFTLSANVAVFVSDFLSMSLVWKIALQHIHTYVFKLNFCFEMIADSHKIVNNNTRRYHVAFTQFASVCNYD